MIALYVRPGCGYSKRVLDAAEKLGVPLDVKDITDFDTCTELEEKGGKVQVPYMVDAERGVSMYESADIIAYLEKTFGKKEDSAG